MILLIEYVPSDWQRSASFDDMKGRAEQIASIDGLRWKYWIRSTEDGRYGGVYLFDTPDQARAGGLRLRDSLAGAGARDVSLRFFEVDADLSAVTRGIVPAVG